MSNIEKIVADFGTCRDASIVGLQIDSYFSWWRYRCTGEAVFVCESSHWGSEAAIFYDKVLFAPTAEEVPLPFIGLTKSRLDIHFGYIEWRQGVVYSHRIFVDQDSFGEATARLKMAIWLIKNVPEAKQWYIDNGYLKDGE